MSADNPLSSVGSFQTFGDLLKYLRRRARLTQRELSIAVNYSEAQISRLERNVRTPDIASLTALFIPALYIEDQPEIISRLMELAAQARGEELPFNITVAFTQSVKKEIVEDIRIIEGQTPNNLPLQLTSFVGRENEIAQLKDLIDRTRLVTLTGPGGCGKTRLALETASQMAKSYQDGVFLVELAPVSNPSHVQRKFISALGLPEPRKETPTAALTQFFQKKHLLLIVDNCEHVLPETAALLHKILQTCPHVRILATSREILNIPGEVRYNVPPLTIGNDIDSESARLFVDRAKAVHPIFELTEDNAPQVVQICRRLEGIPLAIELAAARAAVLTVHQIESLLEDNFQLLEGGNAILERHRTMEATIEWSYNLLSEAERALLRRLSVFSGGWTLEAAKVVTSDPSLVPEGRVLELLSQLVNKSLVIVNWDSQSEARYDILQTVLEFAREKLHASGEMENLRERHFQYFCSMALRREQELLNGKRTIDWAEEEINNLRAVLSWALANKPDGSPSAEHTGQAMELMSHVHLLWIARGYFTEGREWLAKLLEVHPADTLYRARALILASVFARIDGNSAEQFALAQQSMALSRKLESRKHIAWSLCWLGWAEIYRQNYDKAIQYITESLEILKKLKETNWMTYATFFLADSYGQKGNLEAARSMWNQGIELCQKEDFKWHIPWGLEGLGTLERKEGNFDQAKKLYSKSLTIRYKLKDIGGIAALFEALALLSTEQEQYERAAKLWGASERLRLRLNHIGTQMSKPVPVVSAVQSQLGEECFQSRWVEGQAMNMREAVDYALSGIKQDP
ncbi:MAG: AAA family ATPase [Anaerolineales bacterium]|jgi:predicted ATPase/transcriptional regulator with XRE-family HTH domain